MQFPDRLEGYQVRLRSLIETDMKLLFDWRNDKAIRQQMLNDKPLNWEKHKHWFEYLVHKTQEKHYIIEYKSRAIGSININCHSDEEGEIGLYIGEDVYRGNIIAFSPSLLLTDFAFNQLQLTSLASKVRQDNHAAIKYNKQLGYQQYDSDSNFIDILLTACQYHEKAQQLKSLLNRKPRVCT